MFSFLKKLPQKQSVITPQKQSVIIPKQQSVITPKQQAIKDYKDALSKRDPDAMEKALYAIKANCSGANTWCLTEMFCPECPLGMLVVRQ